MVTITVAENSYTPSRCFCIGRNYVAHADELGNAVPDTPVIFMKPAASLLPVGAPIVIPPDGGLHYEAELVILIGQAGKNIAPDAARLHIAGIGLGLDLTLRSLQSELKAKGLPWERAKAFDNSAPLGPFVALTNGIDLSQLHFTCTINGEVRQSGDTSKLIFPVIELIAQLSRPWQLQPGDLIFTGTPAGVGELFPGDEITLASPTIGHATWSAVRPTKE